MQKNGVLQQNRNRWLFAPVLIVLFIVLVIYAKNGIFPFGTESIVHDDMGQCNVPMLYTVWDALHGNGSILLNLRTAGGVFITGAFENACSPLNILFFLICPRDKLLESMSFFLLIKIMLAALTAMLLFTRRFSISPYWCTVLAVCYAFNPFLLQYYSNASWLEVVWVTPLVLLGADRLLQGKSSVLYILSLAYCLIVQLYIAYMVVLFLFLEGAAYILLLLPKDNRKSAAVRFGVSTVLSIILSAFSALPSFFYMTASSRFKSTKSFWQTLLSENGNPTSKFAMATVMTALAFALVLIAVLHIRKQKKQVLFILFSLSLMLIPVVFENVNLLWHMGSYVNFSMRFAFLLQLTLLLTAGYTLQQFPDSLFRGKKAVNILCSIAATGMFAFAVIVMLVISEKSTTAFISKQLLFSFAVMFLALFCAYFLLLKFGVKLMSCILIAVFITFEGAFFFDHSVKSGAKRAFEYSLDFIEECDEIQKSLPIDCSNTARIKNIDGTLNSNYPLIIDQASMSNFTHTIPSEIKKSMQKMGYSTVYTRILDTGGTLFTDALLGYRYALSLTELPEQDYRLCGKSGSYYVYESLYGVPFGTVCSDDVTDPELFKDSAFAANNQLWHCVQDAQEDLLEVVQFEENKDKYAATYDFDVTGTKELYIVCSGSTKRKNMQIYVNGSLVPIPSLGEEKNTRYTTRFNNCLLDIGEFTDCHVTVRVLLLNDTISMDKLVTKIALLDKEKLLSFTQSAARSGIQVSASGRSIRAQAVSAQDGKMLFLPITYDAGWKCTVNGQRVTPERAVGAFMAIPLEQGNNIIQMQYLPSGFLLGVCFTCLALAAVALWLFVDKRANHVFLSTKAASCVLVGYYVADLAAVAALYIIPMICRLITFIT